MTSALHVVDLITTAQDKKFEPPGRMASAILEVVQEAGDCQPEDLKAKGFSTEEIAAHWHFANSIAFVEIRLMAEEIISSFKRELHHV